MIQNLTKLFAAAEKIKVNQTYKKNQKMIYLKR